MNELDNEEEMCFLERQDTFDMEGTSNQGMEVMSNQCFEGMSDQGSPAKTDRFTQQFMELANEALKNNAEQEVSVLKVTKV